jgi:hypothetical protein
MVYETDKSSGSTAHTLAKQINGRVNDITVTVFGEGTKFNGFGSKFSAVLPLLKTKDADSLIVLSDSRDVLINNPNNDERYANTLAIEFRMAYDQLTFGHPDAIVISAEAQCCVSALTHAQPGDYYNTDGTRNKVACMSGTENCLWNGDNNNAAAQAWESFMNQTMIDNLQGTETSYDDMYLNAGLIAGTAKNLIRIIEAAQIGNEEDDQAVLTDYMYYHRNEIVLDYKQTMFGNNRGGVQGLTSAQKCAFHTTDGETRLYHTIANTTPLFIHSPGGFYKCHDKLSKTLGLPITKAIKRRRAQRHQRKTQLCNYMDCSGNDDDTAVVDDFVPPTDDSVPVDDFLPTEEDSLPDRTPKTDLEKFLTGTP